jgi:hypothetical protein
MRLSSVVVLLAVACTADPPTPLDSSVPVDDSVPPDDSTTGDDTGTPLQCLDSLTWQYWADGFFRNYCTHCHSSTLPEKKRQGADLGVDFDTYEGVVEHALAIRYRAVTIPLGEDPDPTLVMPPVGGPSDEERELLGLWIDCGLKRE